MQGNLTPAELVVQPAGRVGVQVLGERAGYLGGPAGGEDGLDPVSVGAAADVASLPVQCPPQHG